MGTIGLWSGIHGPVYSSSEWIPADYVTGRNRTGQLGRDSFVRCKSSSSDECIRGNDVWRIYGWALYTQPDQYRFEIRSWYADKRLESRCFPFFRQLWLPATLFEQSLSDVCHQNISWLCRWGTDHVHPDEENRCSHFTKPEVDYLAADIGLECLCRIREYIQPKAWCIGTADLHVLENNESGSDPGHHQCKLRIASELYVWPPLCCGSRHGIDGKQPFQIGR